ncbi:MAG: hypothetical protein RIR39_1878 [Pseudomonadota bacterium]|jgi:peptidoglycan/LPS O-acetylase OafA/YrhL
MNVSKNHFPWLDLIRFLAAFTVLFVHARHYSFVDYGLLPTDQKNLLVAGIYAISRIGGEAVIMFFVLSGFLVGGVAAVRIREGSFRIADYTIDRLTRIMLPLIPALILAAIITRLIGGGFEFGSFIGNILSLQGVLVPVFGGDAPLWSLAYEVWFYILIAGFGLLAYQGSRLLLGILLIILFMAVFTKLAAVYWFCWLIGAIAFVYRPLRFSWNSMISSVLLTVISIVLVELASPSDSLKVPGWYVFLPSLDLSKLMLAIGMALFIQQILLAPPRNEITTGVNSLGTNLAASAYTLYLTHYPLLQLGEYLGVKRAESISLIGVGVFLSEIIGCLIVAWVIYWLFEKRTTEVRRWIKSKSIFSCHEKC